MKLKLMAAASHHTADFKVLAAEYRFAAEGLESLTPEIKSGLLETGKSLTKEEMGEMVKAIAACKDKKGLEFIMAVLKEAEKSPILTQKAEEIANSIKPKSSKSNTANNKRQALRFGLMDALMDTGYHKKEQKEDPDNPMHGTGPLTSVVNFIYRQGVKLGMLMLMAGFLYALMTVGLKSLTGDNLIWILQGSDPYNTVEALWKSGAFSVVVGIAIKILGLYVKLFYRKM